MNRDTRRAGLGLVALSLSLLHCSFFQGPAAVRTPIALPGAPLQPANAGGYTLAGERCSAESCLFVTDSQTDYPVGLARVSGYYIQLERSAFEVTKQCDSVVITDGPPVLVQSILALIEQGNTVYTRDEAGQPIISIDPGTLSDLDRQRLLESSPAEPVSLVLLADSPGAQDAPVCFSRFSILKLEQ
jgi:hypothetical protein